MREQTPEEQAQGVKEVQLCFKLNNTMPFTKDYDELVTNFSESLAREAV